MAGRTDRQVQALRDMAMALLATCEDMDGIDHINVHADTMDGIAYVGFAAYGPNDAEPTLSWSDFPEGIYEEEDE